MKNEDKLYKLQIYISIFAMSVLFLALIDALISGNYEFIWRICHIFAFMVGIVIFSYFI